MKTTRSRAATIEFRRRASAQVLAEYVIVLAVTMGLVLTLVFLLREIGDDCDRTVQRIGYAVP